MKRQIKNIFQFWREKGARAREIIHNNGSRKRKREREMCFYRTLFFFFPFNYLVGKPNTICSQCASCEQNERERERERAIQCVYKIKVKKKTLLVRGVS